MHNELYIQWRRTVYGAKAEFNDFLMLNGYSQFAKDTGSYRQVFTYKNKISTEIVLIVINHNHDTYEYTLEVKSTNDIHESAHELVERVRVIGEQLSQAYKELDVVRALEGDYYAV